MKKKEALQRVILLLDENRELNKIVHELSSSVDFYRLQSERNGQENDHKLGQALIENNNLRVKLKAVPGLISRHDTHRHLCGLPFCSTELVEVQKKMDQNLLEKIKRI